MKDAAIDLLIESRNEHTGFRMPPSDWRIILWDVDGTLMRSVRHGEYKKYFAPTMKRVFGSCGKLEELQVSGMTDTQIIYEALREEGFTPAKILREKENLLKIFEEEMSRFLESATESFYALKGVRELLAETDQKGHFTNALLTGNLSVAAKIKLKTVELWRFFENSINSFGEISHDRRDLVKEAGKAFNHFYHYVFKPEQFIIIGDTPNDISAARSFGAKCVAVATGKNHSREALLKHKPDIVVDDLADTPRILEILQKL